MARNSGSANRGKSASRRSSAAKRPAHGKASARKRDEARARLLDDRARRDIAGIVIAVIAIVVFVVVVLPTQGVITGLLQSGLHNALGLGSYILPFLLLAVGGLFLARFEQPNASTRISIGLTMIYCAVVILLGLTSPGASDDPNMVFNSFNVVARGGYVGAGIAWVLLELLGQVVSCVIMAGIIVAGLVLVGFSVSGIIERLRGMASYEGEDDVREAEPYAHIARRPRPARAAIAASDDASSQPTSLLGKAKSRIFAPAPDSEPETADLTAVLDGPDRSPSSSGKTARIASSPASMDFDEPEAIAAEGMTRRLGAKHRRSASEPVVQTPPPKSKLNVPSATPQPSEGFELPSMDLLNRSVDPEKDRESEASLQETGACLQETLEDFNINAEVVGWVAGPTVTLFKVDLPAGVRVSRVTALEDDIALALAAPGVRIFAPIPGTNYVGIEVPNRVRQTVLLGDILPQAKGGPLEIAIGKDVEGRSIISDLARMPHLLIGGTTGSGKSVSINAMIMSILMRATPSEVRFIMIDPKRVEFTPYNGIPHLYVPVVTEAKEAASALSWGVAEMERRLKVFSKVGARNISQYNAKVQEAKAAEERALEAGEEPVHWEFDDELPYIVIIIDELADLMMNVGKEVEFSISRIAQLARAAGIHLIVATQRPSTNVVTGLIKANITNRIAFNVASGIDSRVVLDTPGAENLIGLGDLLFSKPEYAKPQRIQGCYVSEDEINEVVEALKQQGEPEYHQEILSTNVITLGASAPDGSGGTCSADDPLLWEAADIVVSSGLGSTSNIQRRLKVGYSRAGRIMDMLEEKGVVGPPNGSKPRDVLVDVMELETLKAFEANDGDSMEG